MEARDPTRRFGQRALDYAKARPGYPEQMLAFFEAQIGLAPVQRVADLGSGTGILTEMLLERGVIVDAVEPNDAMRAEAERWLAKYDGFHSVAATAESTGLGSDSVDWVVAAQAFHWFDAGRASGEIHRILKPGGVCTLIWNQRLTESTDFLRDYEAFLECWGTDYGVVKASYESPEAIAAVLGKTYAFNSFPNAQELNFEGLAARLLSSSYVPAPDDPRAGDMLDELRTLFNAHEVGGTVRIEYSTNVYWARIDG